MRKINISGKRKLPLCTEYFVNNPNAAQPKQIVKFNNNRLLSKKFFIFIIEPQHIKYVAHRY
jgi:hypothetical protein